MANRRILADRSLAPNQEISINPFTSFNSENINKLTRCVTGGRNVIIDGLDVSYNDKLKWSCGDNLLKNQTTKQEFLANWTLHNAIVQYTPDEYSNSKSYEIGDLCHYNYIIYQCKVKITYDGVNKHVWNINEWTKVPINSPQYTSVNYTGFARFIDFVTPSNDNYSYSYIETALDTTKLRPYYTAKCDKDFEFIFALELGSPSCIIVSLNESKIILDHPKPLLDSENNILTYKVRLSKSFLNEDIDNKTLKFRVGAILDGNDPKSSLRREVTDNTVQKTYVRISAMVLKVAGEEVKTSNRYDDTYTIQSIEPSSKIKVSSGVAVKDDVMINAEDKSLLLPGTCMTINVSDPTMWIKNNPYTYLDFPNMEGIIISGNQNDLPVYNQIAFQLNNSKIQTDTTEDNVVSTAFRYDEGFEDFKGQLIVSLVNNNDNDIDIYNTTLLRDNELAFDVQTHQLLDFGFNFTSAEYDSQGNLILTHTYDPIHGIGIDPIPQNKKNLYSDTIYLVYRESTDVSELQYESQISGNQSDVTVPNYNVFYKATLPSAYKSNIGTFSVTIPAKDIPVYMTDPISNIKAYLTVGPIKVSATNYEDGYCKWAYVVLYYNYFKNPKPNVSYIGLIRDTDLDDERFRDDYMILAKLRFVDVNTVDLITYTDRVSNQVHNSKNICYNADSSVWGSQVPTTVEEALNILASKLNSSN